MQEPAMVIAGYSSLLLALLFSISAGTASSLGVNYGTLGNNLPSIEKVVSLLQSTTITKVKLYNADAAVLHALANTGISVIVGIPNESLESLTNPTTAAIWVKQNIAAFEPQTKIIGIAAGNEVLTTTGGYSNHLLASINNLHAALVSLGLDSAVKISTPHSFAILAKSYPPSAGEFHPSYLHVIAPLLAFLSKTGAPLMMNAYPYFAYHSDPGNVSLNYALFRTNHGITDPRTKLAYTNLLDAQLDAAYAAVQRVGFRDVSVTVSETGWPSSGAADEPGATPGNALTYNRNLIDHVASGVGTPLRPNASVDIYIFALFNENLKPGPLSEQYYGLFNADGSPVYDLGILTTGDAQAAPPPSSSASPPSPSPSHYNYIWCIAKPNADDSVLLKALDFACGSADCLAIQRGGLCYTPETLNSHASYAFNAYYQKHGRNFWNCYFSGAGMLSITDPSYGPCKYAA